VKQNKKYFNQFLVTPLPIFPQVFRTVYRKLIFSLHPTVHAFDRATTVPIRRYLIGHWPMFDIKGISTVWCPSAEELVRY
jgi:hypothetical protein